MLIVPMWIHAAYSGTIAYYWREPRRPSQAEIRVATALGNLAAAALGTAELYEEQKRSRERAERSERSSRFLAQAGSVLSSSLDFSITLQNIAKLAVPDFADWCIADVLNDRGEPERVAVFHRDPALLALAEEYRQKYPPGPNDPNQAALRTGKSFLFPEITDEGFTSAARDSEELSILRQLNPRSIIIAPMVTGTQILGSITFAASESGRIYNERDLEIAEELARRAGSAISHAVLLQRERVTAEALRKSNRELRRANDDLNQFAYSASHDLQEPLRMVAIYSQLLERRYQSVLDEKGGEYLRFTLQGAKRMEMLVKDLLAYTQTGAEPASTTEPIEPTDVLRLVLQNLKSTIDDNGATVEFSDLPPLRMQSVHCVQLFQNVIGNAIKYRKLDQAPRIVIEHSAAEAGMIEFRISDNGIGIAPQYHKQIFGLFKRLHTSDKYPGTGIGLALCQRIVERYGGRIWLESQERVGSTFHFTLPVAN
jgi:signal transduction histidine kinase